MGRAWRVAWCVCRHGRMGRAWRVAWCVCRHGRMSSVPISISVLVLLWGAGRRAGPVAISISVLIPVLLRRAGLAGSRWRGLGRSLAVWSRGVPVLILVFSWEPLWVSQGSAGGFIGAFHHFQGLAQRKLGLFRRMGAYLLQHLFLGARSLHDPLQQTGNVLRLGLGNLGHGLLGVPGHPGNGVFWHRFALGHQLSHLFGPLGGEGQGQSRMGGGIGG